MLRLEKFIDRFRVLLCVLFISLGLAVTGCTSPMDDFTKRCNTEAKLKIICDEEWDGSPAFEPEDPVDAWGRGIKLKFVPRNPWAKREAWEWEMTAVSAGKDGIFGTSDDMSCRRAWHQGVDDKQRIVTFEVDPKKPNTRVARK